MVGGILSRRDLNFGHFFYLMLHPRLHLLPSSVDASPPARCRCASCPPQECWPVPVPRTVTSVTLNFTLKFGSSWESAWVALLGARVCDLERVVRCV
jgi:hypothetical protein